MQAVVCIFACASLAFASHLLLLLAAGALVKANAVILKGEFQVHSILEEDFLFCIQQRAALTCLQPFCHFQVSAGIYLYLYLNNL